MPRARPPVAPPPGALLPGALLGRPLGAVLAALLAALLPALLAACADAEPPLQAAVCDDARPCGLGAICVGGFCQPPPPRSDAARPDAAPADGAPEPDPDAAPDPEPDAAPDPDRGPPPDAAPPADAAPDAARDAAVDMAPPDDCGAFGQVCCPGDACRDGACLDGTCAAFGGVYAYGGVDGATCTAGNPLNRDRCTCPAGFVAHPLEDVDFDESEGLGLSHSVYVCAPPADDPAADLRGAFAEAGDPLGAGCPSGCRLGPLQPTCGCPEGTTALTFDAVRQQLRGIPYCPRSLTFCAGGSPLSFGGAYRRWRPETVACREIQGDALCAPNPITGDCTCPEGFEAATLGVMGPHPTRGAPFFCRSDVVVCGARPAR